ncbi:uncharacterized protein L969DRAFT_92326 [Mixia osmundae IAM 14324]|uniref:Uncharacterized protein n=1 Tax=Mixia osmundae (strain CBS 9802 / IAM 14324 / JCM 22182 / KY 12970) TaxID=764103 RepID=G7DTA7_MIXOS|nr:uncharacterized protein L969DRAFT_92326 [Mixia osmundae IAM 14324]KEI42908.1 hypothetical protein L969DRAFT_92326 [Mixia osmundae IAM 14324]GAA93754.1 hypothetical protein E5Q_00400 [Mixia osmundae IAM 14324]
MAAIYTVFTSPHHPPVPDHLPTLIVTPLGKPQQILYTYLHTSYNRENYLLTPSEAGDLCVAKLFPPISSGSSTNGPARGTPGDGHGPNAHRGVKCEASRNLKWTIYNTGVLSPIYKLTLPPAGQDASDPNDPHGQNAHGSAGGGDEQPLFQISKPSPQSPFWTLFYFTYAGHLIPPKRVEFGKISKNVADASGKGGGGTRVAMTGRTEDEKAVWKTLGEGNEDMVEWIVLCAALNVLDDEIIKAAEKTGTRLGVGLMSPPSAASHTQTQPRPMAPPAQPQPFSQRGPPQPNARPPNGALPPGQRPGSTQHGKSASYSLHPTGNAKQVGPSQQSRGFAPPQQVQLRHPEQRAHLHRPSGPAQSSPQMRGPPQTQPQPHQASYHPSGPPQQRLPPPLTMPSPLQSNSQQTRNYLPPQQVQAQDQQQCLPNGYPTPNGLPDNQNRSFAPPVNMPIPMQQRTQGQSRSAPPSHDPPNIRLPPNPVNSSQLDSGMSGLRVAGSRQSAPNSVDPGQAPATSGFTAPMPEPARPRSQPEVHRSPLISYSKPTPRSYSPGPRQQGSAPPSSHSSYQSVTSSSSRGPSPLPGQTPVSSTSSTPSFMSRFGARAPGSNAKDTNRPPDFSKPTDKSKKGKKK